MPSLTNVTFPPELAPALTEAVEHYGFESIAAYFRICGHVLIQHRERGELLTLPLTFLCKSTPTK